MNTILDFACKLFDCEEDEGLYAALRDASRLLRECLRQKS